MRTCKGQGHFRCEKAERRRRREGEGYKIRRRGRKGRRKGRRQWKRKKEEEKEEGGKRKSRRSMNNCPSMRCCNPFLGNPYSGKKYHCHVSISDNLTQHQLGSRPAPIDRAGPTYKRHKRLLRTPGYRPIRGPPNLA